ncbi:phosphatase PAP2 family protein [Corynebacterium diphtheriae]|uniref:phosphatase PAP2 family protein n=1 Tax=Corynebacterium diphtheriae TaxID=1717 RepID=UPI00217564EC|nr:phosphatase PAP2 family protein [Corynebacterium diphtheriae]
MNRLTAACGLAFVLILGVVVSGFTYDAHITAAFNAHKEGAVGSVVGFLYAGLQPRFSLFTTVFIAALVAAARRKVWLGVCYALTVALTWVPVVVMKVVFQRPRPDHALLRFPPEVTPADWSYPSGHTAFVTASVITLYLLAKTAQHQLWRSVAAAGVVLGIVAVAAVVMTQGVHYPTDVLGSVVWAGCVTPLLWDVLSRRIR